MPLLFPSVSYEAAESFPESLRKRWKFDPEKEKILVELQAGHQHRVKSKMKESIDLHQEDFSSPGL